MHFQLCCAFRPDPNPSSPGEAACEGWVCLSVNPGSWSMAEGLSLLVFGVFELRLIPGQPLPGYWREWQPMDTGVFVRGKQLQLMMQILHGFSPSFVPLLSSHAPAAESNPWGAGWEGMEWEEGGFSSFNLLTSSAMAWIPKSQIYLSWEGPSKIILFHPMGTDTSHQNQSVQENSHLINVFSGKVKVAAKKWQNQ